MADRAVRRHDIGLCSALIALAVLLRMSSLGPSSLWLDDAWVAYAHRAPLADLLDIGVTAPGFTIVLAGWFRLVGFSELTAQIPAFVAGIGAPAVAYWVIRHRAGVVAATVAGALVALSPIHIEQSTRVKQYTLEVILGLVILHVALRIIEGHRDRRILLGFGIVAAASVLVSFPLASVAAGAGLGIAVSTWRSDTAVRRRTFAMLATLAVVVAGWFFLVVRHRLYDNLREFWSGSYIDTDDGLRALVDSLRSRSAALSEAMVDVPAVIVAVFVVVGFVGLVRARPVVAVVCATPLVAAVVLAMLERVPLGGGRTDLYLLAPLLVGATLGAADLSRDVSRHVRSAPVAAAAGIALVAGAAWNLDVPSYPEEDIRPLIRHLESNREPDDVVLLYYSSRFAYALYADVDVDVVPVESPYAVEFDDPRLVVQTNQRSDPSRYATFAAAADELGGRIWLLGSHFHPGEWGEIVRQLEEDFGRVRAGRTRLDDADLIWFDESGG